jgi:hypothetical protein
MGSSEDAGVLCLVDEELLNKVHQRIVWHGNVIRYCPPVREAINGLRKRKVAANDEGKEFAGVFQVDIQHAIKCGQSRVVPGSSEQCLFEPGWFMLIHGPTRSGEPLFLKVRVFLSDDESELVRVDSFLISEL